MVRLGLNIAMGTSYKQQANCTESPNTVNDMNISLPSSSGFLGSRRVVRRTRSRRSGRYGFCRFRGVSGLTVKLSFGCGLVEEQPGRLKVESREANL
jgi:hypothetical protein